MARIPRDTDPDSTIESLQGWLYDIQTIIDAATYVDAETEIPADRRYLVVTSLVGVAKRMLTDAQEVINRSNIASWAARDGGRS